MPKLVCISDMHGHLPPLPEGDILVIAGDICPTISHAHSFQLQWLDYEFRIWLQSLSFKDVVLCWGNHDFIGQDRPDRVEQLKLPCHILTDAGMEIQGLKFYGTPWQPVFFDWAFNLYEHDLKEKWASIPTDTDVLVVHGPPHGYGDLALPVGERVNTENVGSPSLTERIKDVKPQLVVYGHIHRGYGVYQIPELPKTILANVSFVNEKYQPSNPPMCFDILPKV